MRFVILTQYFLPEIGAAQTRLAAFAHELRRCGHDVEVVTAMPHHLAERVDPAYRNKAYVRESLAGMTVHRCWVYAASGTGLRRMLNYTSFAVSSLLGLMRVQSPDYIFVESPPLFLCIPAWLASLVFRSVLIFNVSDLWPDSVRELGVLPEGPILRWATALERWAYRRATWVSSVTRGIQRTLADKGVATTKQLYLPNGVDTTVFAPRPPDCALAERLGIGNRRMLLYAGTHGIAQGLETVIEAARLLRDEPFVFVFVGAGIRKSALQALAEKNGLHNIIFREPEPLQAMPAYFSLAFASIVPLVRRELFKSARPSKIFPSLASGVPVIYCGEGEAALLLEGANAGIAVEPESAQELAGAIRRIAAREGLRDMMSGNARALAVSDYAWSTIVDRWLSSLAIGGEARAA